MNGPWRRARAAATVAAALRPDWVVHRAGHELRLRSGSIKRRLPLLRWDDIPLPAGTGTGEADQRGRRGIGPLFLAAPTELDFGPGPFPVWDRTAPSMECPLAAADAIVAGRLRWFSHAWHDVGESPDWHRNPLTGERLPADRHWSDIPDFGAGDIKLIWEPSRFGFTYDLVRAYGRSGDERYPMRWWSLVQSWADANPPNAGPNWKCGQETSLRAMAWCFGLHGFLRAASTSDEQVRLLVRMLAFSGLRIEATLEYALSQHNNHGVSEGMGLFTIGTLFPELGAAERWERTGRHVLERLARGLIYDDGGFAQHSVNYHRLMLDDYVWSIRLAESAGRPLSDELRERVAYAGEWLRRLVEPGTGLAPCYGANDGARVLPLSSTAYGDYRPTVQAAAAVTGRPLPYPPGPWDEALFWIGCGEREARQTVCPSPALELSAESGLLAMHSAQGMMAAPAARFRHRPGHADLLHVDLWWRGVNVAIDPGTFSYNAPAPFGGALAETEVHNAVTLNGRQQMERAGRFLWAPWAAAGWSIVVDRGDHAYAEGWHNGYERLAIPARYRRAIVRLPEEHWLVLDEIVSAGAADVRLHWLMRDATYKLETTERSACLLLALDPGAYALRSGALGGAAEASVTRADPASDRGWCSPHYQHLEPAVSFALTASKERARTLLWSVLGPAGHDVRASGNELAISWAGGRSSVVLGRHANDPLVQSVSLGDGTPTRIQRVNR